MSTADARSGGQGRPRRAPPGPLLRLRASGATVTETVTVAVLTLLVLWLVLYPVGWLAWGALHSGPPGADSELTLDNFREVYLDANHWLLVWRSIVVGVGVTLLATLIGAPLAWLTVKTDLPGKRWVELSAIVPFFTSTFIGALAWIFLGNPTNGALKLWFGIPINVYSVGGIIWVTGLYVAPYMFLFTAAALRNMDTTYEEASFMSRAGLWRTLTRITFPLILPALLSGMTLVFVISMGIFGVAAILGFPAKINLLATDIFVKATLMPPRFGAATLSALTLIVITAALIAVQGWILRAGSYAVVSGRGFRVKLYALGKWTPVALAWCALYALLVVILPALVLIKVSLQPYPTPNFGPWTLDNWTLFFNNDQFLRTLLRSLYLSVGGATVCVLLTAMVAYIVQRSDAPGRRLLEQISVMPIAVPGIVMGMGMVWAYVTWPIWNTLWIVIIAYVTLFMPYGVRALGTNIVQIHRELEESSRVHGGTWFRTFRLIMLPLLRPGIYSTWILLFVIFIREISAAVLLTTTNTRLFPVLIFEQWNSGAFNVMCAGALLLAVIMFAVVLLFKWGFKVDIMPSYR